MSELERAIKGIRAVTGWVLDPLVVLSEARGEWIARATTTHLRPEQEITFLVVGTWGRYVTLDMESLSAMTRFCTGLGKEEEA